MDEDLSFLMYGDVIYMHHKSTIDIEQRRQLDSSYPLKVNEDNEGLQGFLSAKG
jgi:hypothetical protein